MTTNIEKSVMKRPRALSDAELAETFVSTADVVKLLEDALSRHNAETLELRRIVAAQQRVLREQLQMLREAAGMDDPPRERDPAPQVH